MPSNVIISEGRTTNEAIEKGLNILKVSKNMVNIKVIENDDKRSFFSILAPRVVKVELSLKEGVGEHIQGRKEKIIREKTPVSSDKLNKAEKNVEEFLNIFLSKLSNDMTYKISKDEYGLNIIIDGEQSAILIRI